MIAGQHDHFDSGGPAFGNGVRNRCSCKTIKIILTTYIVKSFKK
jgi:hypothetical protein